MIYDCYDVIEVPFPFTDTQKSKIRKALVLSSKPFNETNGVTTLLMITSAKYSQWKGDVDLSEWQTAGLKKPCFARLKIFSIDNKLILSRIGHLSKRDQASVRKALMEFFSLT
jgi:mRNA interferase MazF